MLRERLRQKPRGTDHSQRRQTRPDLDSTLQGRQSLPVSDVKRLLSAAKGTSFYPVYVLAATLGLRRGELLGLRWSEIDFTKNTLEVAQTVQRVSGRLIIDETKSDASDAVVPYPRSPARCCSNTRSTRPRCVTPLAPCEPP